MNVNARCVSIAAWALLVTSTSAPAAMIEDFNTWTEVEDPAHPGMSSNVDSASQITLTASGAIPAGTDIGYQSVNGNTVATSTAGYYFSAGQDFHVAVDFNVSPLGSVGLAGIGFGIGEDGAGMNSAGVGLGIFNGSAAAFTGAARIDDVTQAPVFFGPAATLSGRFYVRYEQASGDIEIGVNTTPGSAAPTHTSAAFNGLQNAWNGDDLLLSFFLRSDAVFPFGPLSAGTLDAVFSNFEVLAGTPLNAVPVPPAAWLFASAFAVVLRLRRG